MFWRVGPLQVGRLGNDFLEVGYVYTPYIPLQIDPFDGKWNPRTGLKSRYGITALANTRISITKRKKPTLEEYLNIIKKCRKRKLLYFHVPVKLLGKFKKLDNKEGSTEEDLIDLHTRLIFLGNDNKILLGHKK